MVEGINDNEVEARRTAEERFSRTRFAGEFARIYRRLAGAWN